MNPPALPVIAVHAPTVVEEPAPGAAAGEAAQPEVITAKKPAEEGAAAGGDKGKAEKK
jgi:hypothetical protein